MSTHVDERDPPGPRATPHPACPRLSWTTGTAASGKPLHQRRPGAVVDAPAVDIGTYPGGVNDVADLCGHL